MSNLPLPPTGATFNFKQFKDWFYKLWKAVSGMTFGGDATSYSGAIMALGQDTMGGSTSYIGNPIIMRAGNSSGQSFATGTTQVVTGWTTQIDNAIAFNASTGVYTVPIGGYYQVYAHVLFNSGAWAAGSATVIRLLQNSTNVTTGGWNGGAAYTGFQLCTVSGVLSCVKGDTISVEALQSSGGTLALYSSGPADALTWNNFHIIKVG